MKIASYRRADGVASYGVVEGAGLIDMGPGLGGRYATLRCVLAADALEEVAAAAKGAAGDLRLDDVTLLPPIADPEKIVCVGKNYRGHAAEAGAGIPEHPTLFLRLTNTLVPHGGAMIRSRLSADFDYEGELAVIIGKAGRHIAPSDAMRHVAGYSCFNDGSFRDVQFKHSTTAGKNFPATGGFGPFFVTADDVPDPTQLTLVTRLNGREVQTTRTDDLIFDIPTLIAYVSGFTPLEPGDVISTGTPEGVGFARKPPLWMKDGDVVEVEISSVGLLRNPVRDEA